MGDDVGVSKTLQSIGMALETMGKFERVEDMYREVLWRNETVGESQDVSDTLSHIARSYAVRRNYLEAIKYFQISVNVKNADGGAEVDIADCLLEIGRCYGSMGLLDNALEACHAALKTYVEMYGFLHPAVSNAFNTIGNAYVEVNLNDTTLKKFKMALGITLLLPNDRHGDETLADILHNIGNAYRSQGYHADSIQLLTKAIQIYEKLYGRDHVKTADSVNNLGAVLCAEGNEDEAIDKFKHVARLYRDTYGKDYIGRAVVFKNLGLVFVTQKRYEDAVHAFRQAYEIYKTVLGVNHEHTGDVLYELAATLYRSGQTSLALEEARNVQIIWEHNTPNKLETIWGKWIVALSQR